MSLTDSERDTVEQTLSDAASNIKEGAEKIDWEYMLDGLYVRIIVQKRTKLYGQDEAFSTAVGEAFPNGLHMA